MLGFARTWRKSCLQSYGTKRPATDPTTSSQGLGPAPNCRSVDEAWHSHKDRVYMEPPGGRRHSTSSDGISSYKQLYVGHQKSESHPCMNSGIAAREIGGVFRTPEVRTVDGGKRLVWCIAVILIKSYSFTGLRSLRRWLGAEPLI